MCNFLLIRCISYVLGQLNPREISLFLTFSQRSSKISRLFPCYDQKAFKMHSVIFLFIIVYLLEFNLANSKRSSKEQDKYVISFVNEDSYTKPYPLLLNTTFKIREFISIDENENSISIRVNLLSKWKDSGLKCSDKMDQ